MHALVSHRGPLTCRRCQYARAGKAGGPKQTYKEGCVQKENVFRLGGAIAADVGGPCFIPGDAEKELPGPMLVGAFPELERVRPPVRPDSAPQERFLA